MAKRQIVVACLTQEIALGVLRDCLEDGEIIPSRHFRAAMAEEGITFEDAWNILRTGTIYDPGEHDVATDDWKYRIEGIDTEGREFGIIFCFKAVNRVLLITIFSVSAQKGGRTKTT